MTDTISISINITTTVSAQQPIDMDLAAIARRDIEGMVLSIKRAYRHEPRIAAQADILSNRLYLATKPLAFGLPLRAAEHLANAASVVNLEDTDIFQPITDRMEILHAYLIGSPLECGHYDDGHDCELCRVTNWSLYFGQAADDEFSELPYVSEKVG